MQENRVSITLAAADAQKIKDAIKAINDVLKPHLIALTNEERKTIPKMGESTLPFVQKVLDYAVSNPPFVPAYIDVPELKIDVDAVGTLLGVLRPLQQLTQNLDDTTMLCGSEAYVASLAFYNSVKQAAKMNVPGAKAIAEDLKVRFEKAGQKKDETPSIP